MATPPRAVVNRGQWSWAALAAAMIVGSAALRLAYMLWACPLDLAPDEAHYWDWSRHLDWSYYSKGPLVAYLIRAGTVLAGDWSRRLTGQETVAVRLPAIACGTALLASMYVLATRVYGSRGLGAAVVAAALTLPMVGAGSSIMTIDAPYTCCWGIALVRGHEAVRGRWRWAWPCLGAAIGLGILAKYTMVLFVPSLALFLLTSREHRRLLLRPGFFVMCLVAGTFCLPIVFWNMAHGWVTWRHVHGQAGLSEDEPFHWLGPVAFVGAQFGLLLGFWFVAWVAALWVHRPWREQDADARYLWWMSVPMFGTFLLFAFKTGGGEPNWPVTTYESGLILAAGMVARGLADGRPALRRWLGWNLAAACCLGVLVSAFMYRSDLAQPVLLRMSGPQTDRHPMPLRRFDPTCRLRGWRFLAGEVAAISEQLRAQGSEPILAGTGWALPGEIAFYTPGHPIVYSLGLALGDRHSQYDFWHPNPLAEPELFRGQTFIVVGGLSPRLGQAFGHVERLPDIVYREKDQPVASWPVAVCHDFKGFPVDPTRPSF